MPVARRAVDRVARIGDALAGLVDILDPVSEMPEIAPAIISLGRRAILGRPVIGKLDLGNALFARRG